jgi:hypothetical protein
MKVQGDYHDQGYALVEGFLPVEVVREFLTMLKADIDHSPAPLSARKQRASILKRPAVEVYGSQHKPMMTLLWGLTPIMCHLVGRELLPTYGYFRVYQRDDVLWVHSDRYACEHSLSLTLAYSDGVVWPFEIAHQRLVFAKEIASSFESDPYSAIEMQPGDAIVYQGVHHRHARLTPNPNRWSAHLFLHWVDRAGPFREHAFDGKAAATDVDFGLS